MKKHDVFRSHAVTKIFLSYDVMKIFLSCDITKNDKMNRLHTYDMIRI